MSDPDVDEPLTFGVRLQMLRENRGLTRPVLAGLVGRSPGWVKRAEKQNVMPDLTMLVRLAQALRLRSVEDLVGPLEIPLGIDVRSPHEAAGSVREAIMTWDDSSAGEPVPGGKLLQRVREAMALWQMSPAPREATSTILPELIRDGRRSVHQLDGVDRRVAAAALVEIYTLAEHWLSWIGDRGLMMVLVDRAMWAAEQADTLHALGIATWAYGNVHRYVDSDYSIRLVDAAAKPLRKAMDDGTATTEEVGIWGSLRMHNAITHAKSGREGESLRYMDDVDTIADRLPAGWSHPITVFAPFNVKIHQVSVAAELCKGNEGARLALSVDPDTVPGPYRRSRLWLDAARSWWAAGDALGAMTALSKAVDTSLENMQYRPAARGLVSAIVSSGGSMVAGDARRLAHRLDVAV